MQIVEILDQVLSLRGRDFLANDPLQFPRRFSEDSDREVAAFVSALLAYGQVSVILGTLDKLFGRISGGLAEFAAHFDPRRDMTVLSGVKHRFHTDVDLGCLFLFLRHVLQGWGSLEAFFADADGEHDVESRLNAFSRRALALDYSAVPGSASPARQRALGHFFPAPSGGSACKRLCLFLRWVVRPDDGFDLGLWRVLTPADLVMPLDTHTARISRLLGLTRRSTPNWRMACEITGRLAEFNAADPVRYDFALSHLGISGGCRGRSDKVCLTCPLNGMCVTVS